MKNLRNYIAICLLLLACAAAPLFAQEESEKREKYLLELQLNELEIKMPDLSGLEKIVRNDASPALRYEAVRQLGRFRHDDPVVSLLAEVIKKDKNIHVRKKAVYYLGKSNNPRAIEAIEEIFK